MYVVVSPAKKLDFETKAPIQKFTRVSFPDKSQSLIDELKSYSKNDIAKLMKLSDSLAKLNWDRFQNYHTEFTLANSKQAIFAFKGDTYVGFDADTMSEADLLYAQNHLGILSGLYGIVKPLDLIQPYRLEMGTKFSCNGHKNLYEFWNPTITDCLNKILKPDEPLINLSSKEYFTSVKEKEIKTKVITPVFKEKKGSTYKVIGFSAKRARGMMARYIMENKITQVEDLKSFDVSGYTFSKRDSNEYELTFLRDNYSQ